MALAQLVYNLNGEPYHIVASTDKLRELEMRIQVLENHLKIKKELEDKYIIVLGE